VASGISGAVSSAASGSISGVVGAIAGTIGGPLGIAMTAVSTGISALKDVAQSGVDFLKSIFDMLMQSSAFLQQTFKLLQMGFLQILRPFADMFARILLPIAVTMNKAMAEVYKEIQKSGGNITAGVINEIATIISTSVNELLTQLTPAFTAFLTDMAQIAATVVQDPKVQSAIKTAFSTVLNAVTPLILTFFQNIVKPVLDAISTGILDWATGTKPNDYPKNDATSLLNAGNNSPMPGVLPTFNQLGYGGGGNSLTETLRKLHGGASGAIVSSPTLAMIGEGGPEVLMPLSSAPGASALPGGGGFGGVTINLNAPVYGVDNLKRAIWAAMDEYNVRARWA
jgi:phage-related protein